MCKNIFCSKKNLYLPFYPFHLYVSYFHPLFCNFDLKQTIFLKLVPLEPFKWKFSAILEKNPDLKAMKNGSVLKGEATEMNGMALSLLYKFWNTLITSVDCKRTFSKVEECSCRTTGQVSQIHICDILLMQWNKQLLK